MNNYLQQASYLATLTLSNFANKPHFWQNFELAFGNGYDRSQAEVIRQEVIQGSLMLPIRVLDDDAMGKAVGAFAAVTNTIYLQDSFVKNGDLRAIGAVIVEELGHSIDSRVNKVETPGDEGAIFRLLVGGGTISADLLAELKAEDDWGTILVDGQELIVEMAVPTEGDDTLIGDDFDNYINGLGGNDLISGLAGNDYLNGGIGNDYLNGDVGDDILDGRGDITGLDTFAGGAGNDTYGIYNSATSIIENDNEGLDTVWTVVDYILPFSLDRAYLVGNTAVTGNAGNNVFSGYGVGNNTIYGLGGDDVLYGGEGNDYLNGGIGRDYLDGGVGNDILDGNGDTSLNRGGRGDVFAGGAGDDTYGIYSSDTRIIENAGEGTDTVWTIVNYYSLDNNVENLYLVGNIIGRGNNENNIIVGYGADDHAIDGLGGDDFIFGGTGRDTINGGAGADTLTGGSTGADIFGFQFGQSTYLAADHITDFSINTDKIRILNSDGTPTGSPTSLSRANDDNNSTTLLALAEAAFADADGALIGNQSLTNGDAAIVVSTGAGIAGTYLVIDGYAPGFNADDLIVVNITGFSGNLPSFGSVPFNSFFG
jgi:Ca2+-binding RTX toxin-like protein